MVYANGESIVISVTDYHKDIVKCLCYSILVFLSALHLRCFLVLIYFDCRTVSRKSRLQNLMWQNVL